MKDNHKVYILYQLLQAVKYLHSAGIVQKNLKPSNILINNECIIKVADFMSSKFINEVKDQEISFAGYVENRWYDSPELLLGCTVFSKEMDIWSLGCIFGEILLGKPLFPGTSTMNQLDRILELTGFPSAEDILSIKSSFVETFMENITVPKKRSLKKELSHCTPETRKLLKRFLVFNPSKRILIEEAFAHPYLSQFFDVKDIRTRRKPLKRVFDLSKVPSMEYAYELLSSFKKNCDIRKRSDHWPKIHRLLPPKKKGMVEEVFLILQILYQLPNDLSVLIIQHILIYFISY
uniref:Protein kinase domain-containing protein n=1 Tax=Arcella intermedia TaxID=1963864 RepID=A0A6B2LC85_9EUKA